MCKFSIFNECYILTEFCQRFILCQRRECDKKYCTNVTEIMDKTRLKKALWLSKQQTYYIIDSIDSSLGAWLRE